MGKGTDQSNNLQSLYITIQNDIDSTKIVLYQQTEEFKFKLSSEFSIPIAHKSQPFFADIDGDLK